MTRTAHGTPNGPAAAAASGASPRRVALVPPAMTDEQMAVDQFVRVLMVRWDEATVTLASGAVRGELGARASHWVMPRLPAEVIHAWLPEILPLLNRALAKSCLDEDGVPRFPDGDGELDAVSAAVDAFTRAWCGRPAPRGHLAECAGCRAPIERSIERTSGVWMRRAAPGRHRQRMADFECPTPAGESWMHERVQDYADPGSIRLDYRPYHDLELIADSGGFTGRCACGGWSAPAPSPYVPLLVCFDVHANTPTRTP